MEVRLTEHEIALAHLVAGQIAGQNVVRERKPRYGAPKNDWGPGVLGALGEIALAKATNRFWSGNVGNLKAKDVGGIQARATRTDPPCLILHTTDADTDPFVCISFNGPVAKLHGWILGREGKRDEFWKETSRPAYFVPLDRLRPLHVVRIEVLPWPAQ